MGKHGKEKKERKERKGMKKEKKSRKRKREERATSSDSGDSDPEVRAALAAMRRSELEEKLRKKAEKRRQEKLLTKFGYTNEINPFGDPSLNARFVWRKKDNAAASSGSAKKGSGRLRSLKQADEEDERLLLEIDGVRRRRQEREEELAERERLREEEGRLREAATHADWADKEEAFHLEANQTRTKIRLLEGRAEPIDILARNVLLFGGEKKTVGINYQGDSESLDISSLGAELKAPADVFKGLQLEPLRRLRDQIDDFLRLEGDDGEFRNFWLSLGIVCEHHVARQERLRSAGRNPHAAFEEAETIEDRVEQELEACSNDELQELQEEVRKEAASGGDEYWELVARQLRVELANRRLHEMHVKMLTQQLEKRAETAASTTSQAKPLETSVFFRNVKSAADDLEVDAHLDNSMAAIAMQRAEEAKELAENEERMKLDTTGEPSHEAMAVPIASNAGTDYDWADKYQPRKPRFFNRVRTGYDWNMYNRSHYDYDNPPPKTVQGYKFNIFCPDKIDTTHTPSYTVEGADDPNFAIILFDMGAPYEKIAFTILNREWAIGRKKGFRCSYERGVFQLHFNFKRSRYRR